MRPQTIGRVLGIGVRVAGRMAGQRMAASGQTPAAPEPLAGNPAARKAGRATGSVARGVGGFLRPFQRVGGILWLEITGAFFLLFAIAFGCFLWSHRTAWAQGQDHGKLTAEAVLAAVFLYLGVSSFWRARRR
ncbi:MAG: hypothetical protein WCE75_16095 [Terracidiphilus sp.]